MPLPSPTWDILVPTIPHRHEELCRLLAELGRQWQPGLGVRVLRDNLERPGNASYGKWQDLVDSSSAEYVNIIADDDWVAPGYVAAVMAALEGRPDYVGFRVAYTLHGVPQVPVEHSLRHGRWHDFSDVLVRDIVHHNPIRRELALLAPWGTGQITEDRLWAARLRATGRVRTEVFIPEPLYHYRASSRSWSVGGAPRQPLPAADILPLPSYPWLEVL